MSSISSPPATSFALRDTGDGEIAAVRSAQVSAAADAAGDTTAVPDAAPTASEMLTRLGLAGLRAPSGTGDISVLLAQTLVNIEEARGDAQRSRAELAANTALSVAGRFNTATLRADLADEHTNRKALGDELTAATKVRDDLQAESTDLGEKIVSDKAEVAAARQTLADAKTPEQREAAQRALDRSQSQLTSHQDQKAKADASLVKAEEKVTSLTGQVAASDAKITLLGRQIDTLTQAQQIIAAAFAITETARIQTEGFVSRSLDLYVEDLFTAIQNNAADSAQAANPLLRQDRTDEPQEPAQEAPPPPPPRPVAVAAALGIALSDLLRELDAFDPLLLARPPEQTGLERLRLRV